MPVPGPLDRIPLWLLFGIMIVILVLAVEGGFRLGGYQSLNRAIELHTTRVRVAVRSGIPGVLWAALFAVAILNLMAVGYHAGLLKTRRSPAVATLVMSLSVVMLFTADLDRPQEGAQQVSQQAMIDLRRKMGD